MKNKILIFIFCIITFGLFAIPLSFAKDYNVSDLDYVNRVNRIVYFDNERKADIYLDLSDLTGTSHYWYISFTFFDNNYNNINLQPHITLFDQYYKTTIDGYEQASAIQYSSIYNNYCFYQSPTGTNNISGTTNLYNYHVNLRFDSDLYYNNFKNGNYKVNGLAYRTNSTNAFIPYVNYFIGNYFYESFVDRGVFVSSSVELLAYGTTSKQDISSRTISFNNISFDDYLVNYIYNTNNNYSNNNYYIRVYFRQKLKYLTNFNVSYLEFYQMRMNGSFYGSYSSARNALPILSSNLTLYNNTGTLFTTDDLINSGYGEYYLEYIDFNIANYSFKSSSYYNSSLGINGYLQNTYISAIGFNGDVIYDNGYSVGYKDGFSDGKDTGYNEGVASNTSSFDNLMLAVANVPMTIISSMLSFEILGVNLLAFFMGIITLLLFVKLMRKFKE